MARRIVAGAGAGSRVIGVGRLRGLLKRLPATITAPVKAAIKDGAEEIRAEMLTRVPVRDGDLAAGIGFKISGDKLSAKIGFFGKRVMRKVGWRAKFAEFGYGPGIYKRGPRKGQSFQHVAGRAFMVPAMRASRDNIIRDIDRRVDRALAKAGRV